MSVLRSVESSKSDIVRTARTPQEREVRSRGCQILGRAEFLFGNLVYRERACGSKGCHCEKGPKHRSPYLIRTKDARFQAVIIPWDLEPQIKQWVENGRRLRTLIREVSEIHWEKLLEEKKQRKRRKES